MSPSTDCCCGQSPSKGTHLSETAPRPSEPHKPSNVLDLRTLLTVRLSRDDRRHAVTVIARTSAGTYYEAGMWLWDQKGIPAPMLQDVINSLGAHLTTALVHACGVQEVLEGMPSVP